MRCFGAKTSVASSSLTTMTLNDAQERIFMADYLIAFAALIHPSLNFGLRSASVTKFLMNVIKLLFLNYIFFEKISIVISIKIGCPTIVKHNYCKYLVL